MQMIVFGGSGRVGQVLCRAARAAGWDVLAPAHAECDLAQPGAAAELLLAHAGAEAVVNCAAISGLEVCADNPLLAHRINAMAPAEMALICRHTGARFLHLSTDYVLDGRRPGLKAESAKCKPINTYGESKREGEQQILDTRAEALILRVSWVCGNPERPSFVESTLARALSGQPLAAIDDKYSLPTHAADIARALLALIPRPESGILHLTSGSSEPLSWHSCATLALQEAVRSGALPEAPPITRQHLREAAFFREPRPVHTAMDTTALQSALGHPLPTAEATLRRAVQDYLSRRR